MTLKPWLRRSLIALAALLALLAIGAAVLVATFDAERYKGVAIDWVKREYGRTLSIDGPIGLSVLPRLQITVAKLKLSERGRPDEFAAIDSAGFALELLPLLRRQVVIDRVQADGVRLRYSRDAKGASNIDDFLKGGAPATAPASAPAATPTSFDVSGIALRDVRLSMRDAQAKLTGDVVLKSLTSGRIGTRSESPVSIDAALAFSEPKLKGTLAGQTRLALDAEAGAVRLSDMKLKWQGDAFDLRGLDVALDGALAWDGKALAASDLALTLAATLGELKLAGSKLTVKTFRFDPERRQLQLDALQLALTGTQAGNPLKLALDWPQLQASADALKGSALKGSVSLAGAHKLDGTFRSGAPAGNFEQVRIPSLVLDLAGSSGPRSVKGTLGANVTLRPQQRTLALDALALQANVAEPNLQALAIQAKGSASAGAGAARWNVAGALNANRFEIDGNAALGGKVPVVKAQAKFDALDLNRLLASPAAGGDKAPSGPQPAQTPVDLGGLKAVDGQFAFSAGQLAFRQYRVADARADASLDNGLLRIPRLAGKAWGGTIDASGSADANGNKVAVKLAASGVDANALLKDVAGKDLLEGTGKVTADLTTRGATLGELRSGLDGTAALNLRDGAIKGFNLARALRQAKAALSMRQDAVQQARQTEKTDFSELSASAKIIDGVARSDDLDVKSPFLRIGGAGTFDIGKGRIDYVAKATVADTSKGQGGAELDALRGVTVPVRLAGPFDAIDWNIQWSAVAAAAVQNQLKDRLLERLGGTQRPGGAASQPLAPKDAAKEQLKDRLRGLLK